jgi:hypothetical protein
LVFVILLQLKFHPKLFLHHEKKEESSRIRSKVNWYEKGEKSTKYFFNLEKKKGKETGVQWP